MTTDRNYDCESPAPLAGQPTEEASVRTTPRRTASSIPARPGGAAR